MKMINPEGKYLTVHDLSKLLKITPASIIASINRKELPAIRIGASYRVDVSQPLPEIRRTLDRDREAVEVCQCQ